MHHENARAARTMQVRLHAARPALAGAGTLPCEVRPCAYRGVTTHQQPNAWRRLSCTRWRYTLEALASSRSNQVRAVCLLRSGLVSYMRPFVRAHLLACAHVAAPACATHSSHQAELCVHPCLGSRGPECTGRCIRHLPSAWQMCRTYAGRSAGAGGAVLRALVPPWRLLLPLLPPRLQDTGIYMPIIPAGRHPGDRRHHHPAAADPLWQRVVLPACYV